MTSTLNIPLFKQNILVVIGVGLIFFIKLYLNIRNFFAKSIMNSELIEIESDVLLDLKIRSYSYLSKTLHLKKSELLLASLLKIHIDNCKDAGCPCKNRKYLYDPKKLEIGSSFD